MVRLGTCDRNFYIFLIWARCIWWKQLLINQSGKRFEALKCQKIRNSRLAILGMIYCLWDLSYIQRWAQNGPARYLGREYQYFLYWGWTYKGILPQKSILRSDFRYLWESQSQFYTLENFNFWSNLTHFCLC